MIKKIQLPEIIPKEELKRLHDALKGVTIVQSAIVDSHGAPYYGDMVYNPFCSLARSSPAGSFCRKSDHTLNELAAATQKLVVRDCENLGVTTACAPIIINEDHIATIKMGQVCRTRLPESAVRNFAHQYGLPEEETVAAYNAVPLVSEEEFERATTLLTVFAEILTEKAYHNYLLQKADEEKERLLSVLNTVVDNVEAVIYVADPQTHELAFTNEYTRKLMGEKDLEGRLCYEVFHHADSPCAFCPEKTLFNAAGAPVNGTLHGEFHNTDIGRDFLMTDRVVKWYDGRYMHMNVASDITERNALVLANAGNRAKREFLARMSHELRTPMNGVLGMTHLALSADPPTEQQYYLKKIQASASILLDIINDILDFSRIEEGKMTLEHHPLCIRELVTSVVELIKPGTEEKGVTLSVSIGPEVPDYAVGDPVRISQILLNLLGNAAKFTADGMIRLIINTKETENGAIRLKCSVADTGIGIESDQLETLFAPFTQADASVTRRFGGTGLGLSITRMLVELMDGKIEAFSQPGEGSVFSFHILLGKAAGLKPEIPQAAREIMSLKGKRILVVEDNTINQEVITSLLREMDISVDVAENGEKGVAAFLRNDYDLVFMDIRMPVMDGLEATRRIRASDKYAAGSIPVIAMTANAMAEDKRACLAAGMEGHIAKPIIIEDLNAVLARYLAPKNERLTA